MEPLEEPDQSRAPQREVHLLVRLLPPGEIDHIGSMLNSPDIITLDPYVFSHHTGDATTFEGMAGPKLTWLRARAWYAGQPIAFTEYAIDKTFGDAKCAEFYTNLRPRMAALGIHAAILFSRDKSGYGAVQANVITTDTFPLAKPPTRHPPPHPTAPSRSPDHG